MSLDYEQLRRELTWDVAERELGYRDGDPVNIAYLCVDRHVEAGLGDRPGPDPRRPRGGTAPVHVPRPAAVDQRLGALPARQRVDPPARPGVPVPRQGAGALHRVPGHPEDRGRRGAALLGLRRGRSRGAHARQPGRGHHHAAPPPGQGAQGPRAAARPQDDHRHRPRRGREEAARGRGRLPHDGSPRGPFPHRGHVRREPERAALHQRHDRRAEGRHARARQHLRAVPHVESRARHQGRTTSTGAPPTPDG